MLRKRSHWRSTIEDPCFGFTGKLCKDANEPPCSGVAACVNANIDYLVVRGCRDGPNSNSLGASCLRANIGTVYQGCNEAYACLGANIPGENIINCCNTQEGCLDITSLPDECNKCTESVTCIDGVARNFADGTMQTCEEACNGECCVGFSPCDRFTGTLCKAINLLVMEPLPVMMPISIWYLEDVAQSFPEW